MVADRCRASLVRAADTTLVVTETVTECASTCYSQYTSTEYLCTSSVSASSGTPGTETSVYSTHSSFHTSSGSITLPFTESSGVGTTYTGPVSSGTTSLGTSSGYESSASVSSSFGGSTTSHGHTSSVPTVTASSNTYPVPSSSGTALTETTTGETDSSALPHTTTSPGSSYVCTNPYGCESSTIVESTESGSSEIPGTTSEVSTASTDNPGTKT